VYLGDNARAPYGPRTADEVRSFTKASAAWLFGQDVKMLVLACNTATSHALPMVRQMASVPVLGVVRPGALAAAASTRAGHVGVIATAGTVASGAYALAVGEADPALMVTQVACPDLVPLVEAGQLSGPIADAAVRGYLGELFEADRQIDTLLLGCTHYPLLRPLIEEVAGPRVAVVDSAFTTALAVEDLLDALGGRATTGAPAGNRIATTGDVNAFLAVAGTVFGASLPSVEQVVVAAD
jgi:glutamate racemase